MEASATAWDTHVHVFDHSLFPFKPNRIYTPQSVSLRSVAESSGGRCHNFVFVQASFEDGPAGILHHLRQAREQYSNREFRAEIFWDERLAVGAHGSIDDLHRQGVRCLRLHAEYGDGNSSIDGLLDSFRALCSVAQRHRWAVAAQLPLDGWLEIAPSLGLVGSAADAPASASDPLRDPSVAIIAEHFGSPPAVPLTAAQEADFEAFVDLAATSTRFHVKLCGLHRRIGPLAQVEDVVPLANLLARRAPRSLLYGSDYPHVDVTAQSRTPTPLLDVDHHREAAVLQGAMTEECWRLCLCDNPHRIFH